MFKMVNKVRDRKGFTLIELLIVVAIIGILAAIAIPAFLGQQKKAKSKSLDAGCNGIAKEAGVALASLTANEPIVMFTTTTTKMCFSNMVPPNTGLVDTTADGIPDMDMCQAKFADIALRGTYGANGIATAVGEIAIGIQAEQCGGLETVAAAADLSTGVPTGSSAVAAQGGLTKNSPYYPAQKCLVEAMDEANVAAAVGAANEVYEGMCILAYSDAARTMRVIMIDDDGLAGSHGETKIFLALGGD